MDPRHTYQTNRKNDNVQLHSGTQTYTDIKQKEEDLTK